MASSSQRRAGLIQLQVNGVVEDAKGAFTYNLGNPKREAIIGADGIHGYKETPQVAFIEGEITDRGNLDVKKFTSYDNLTVTLTLSNGKVVTLFEAWFAGEGTVSTDEANMQVRWEGSGAEEVSVG